MSGEIYIQLALFDPLGNGIKTARDLKTTKNSNASRLFLYEFLILFSGEIWPEVFKSTNLSAIGGVTRLVAKLIERELDGYRSGVYQISGTSEPANLTYLQPYSVVRGVMEYIKKQVYLDFCPIIFFIKKTTRDLATVCLLSLGGWSMNARNRQSIIQYASRAHYGRPICFFTLRLLEVRSTF